MSSSCCCPPDSEPARASAPSVSAIVTTGDHQTAIYATGPPTAEIGILAFPDLLGLDSGRTKADADRLGALGYAVALVDVAGDAGYVREDQLANMASWIQTVPFEDALLPHIRDAIDYLIHQRRVRQIVSYGYCWGAWVGARLSVVIEGLLPTEQRITCRGHVSFHPSWRVETVFNGDGAIERLAERVRVPQLLLPAGNDLAVLREHGAVQEILAKHERAHVRSKSRVVDFPEVKHGWVNRGDLADPTVRENVERAWQVARTFIRDVTTTDNDKDETTKP